MSPECPLREYSSILTPLAPTPIISRRFWDLLFVSLSHFSTSRHPLCCRFPVSFSTGFRGTCGIGTILTVDSRLYCLLYKVLSA